MDDHLFEMVLDYGKCELIPRIIEEYQQTGALKRCDSYDEALDFCRVLTILDKYGGRRMRYTPKDLLDMIL